MSDWKRLKALFIKMPLFEKSALVFLLTILIAALAHLTYTLFSFTNVNKDEQTYTEGFIGRVATLNPLYSDFNDVDRDLTELIFSGLIKYDPVERNFVPDLAKKWERSKNGLTYVFTLRDDVKWHDGEPLTIDDVIFTYKGVIKNPDFRNPILKNTFVGVDVDRTGDNTITFTLTKPNSYFISNLTTGIVPQHILTDIPIATLDSNQFSTNPIGSGPYNLVSLKRGEDGDIVELHKNESYYDTTSPIENLKIFVFRTERELLLKKETLLGLSKLAESAKSIISNIERFAINQYTLNQFTAIYFNTENPLLKEKSIRTALTSAINKEKLLTSDSMRIDTINLENKKDDPAFAFDFEKSKNGFKELEFRVDEKNKLVSNKGVPLELTVLALEKTPIHLTDEIKRQWEELGVKVTIDRQEGPKFASYLGEGRYDVLLIRQNLGYNRDMYPLIHSSQIGSSGLNFSRFKSFGTDGLTEAIRKETFPKDKEKLLSQLSDLIKEEKPIVFISTPIYTYALDKKIQPFPDASLDFHSDRLTILSGLDFVKSETLAENSASGKLSIAN